MADSKKLVWDAQGEHFYETGVANCALYVAIDEAKDGHDLAYDYGVAWNGITAFTNSPSGAEETALYANDNKYLSLRSKEDFGGTIEAYTYPPEWAACDGLGVEGNIYVSQQGRKSFGLSYETRLGNDIKNDAYGKKVHLIYGASASPSEKAYSTVNDSPEAITFSWEISTIPTDCVINGKEFGKCSHLEVSSTDFMTEVNGEKVPTYGWTQFMNAIHGTETTEPYLPSPSEVYELLYATESE